MAEPEVKALPDAELLRLCDSTMEPEDQQELSDRLADAREGRLDEAGRVRLDELMARYRRGLVLKARAWEEAVRAAFVDLRPTTKPTPIMPRESIPAELDRRIRRRRGIAAAIASVHNAW